MGDNGPDHPVRVAVQRSVFAILDLIPGRNMALLFF
jgi:hypothetical protein